MHLPSLYHHPHRAWTDAKLPGRALDSADGLIGLLDPQAEDGVAGVGAQAQASALEVTGHGLAVEAEQLGDIGGGVACPVEPDHLVGQLWPEVAIVMARGSGLGVGCALFVERGVGRGRYRVPVLRGAIRGWCG